MQDYAITDFSGGLLTNAAYHAGRNKSAQYVRENRVDEQGWLIPRKGYIRISGEQNIVEIFVHKTILLAIVNGYLKWSRLQDDNEQLIFNDFVQGGYLIKSGSERVVFHKVDDNVYIGTGKASFVVNVLDVPNVPTVEGFYLPQPEFEYIYVGTQPGSPNSRFWVKAQFIRTDGTVADVNDLDPTDDIRIAEANVVSAPSEARYVDADDAGTRTVIQMRVEGAAAGLVDYVDFFRTERGAEEESEYYWFFRVPYRPADQVNPLLVSEHSFVYNTTIPRVSVNWSIPFDDDSPTNTLGPATVIDPPLLNRDELVKVNADQPNFQHITSSEFRTYAADPDSNRVWISYYDPAKNLSLKQNFTDFIPLDLGGAQITGLHFLRDTFLYVYTTNQIQVISTDPIAELHRVVDFIKPRDEKGEVIGCAAPDSIVNILGRHYFFATNQRVYRFDGQRLYDVSDRVHGEFQKVVTNTEDGEIQLQPIIGYATDEDYFLSVPMSIPDVDVEYPNMQMVYDTSHGVWWQDSYGVRSASKSAYKKTYGVVDGELCLLHFGDTDAGVTIRRKWRGHPFLTTTQKAWESVHVHPLIPCQVDVIAHTEQDEKQGSLDIQNIAVFDQKRMGCNLRGLTQTVEIQTDSLATIHRISINEKVRNR